MLGHYLYTRGCFPHIDGRGELNTFAELKDLCFIQQVGEMKYKGIIASKKNYVPTSHFLNRAIEVSFTSEAT